MSLSITYQTQCQKIKLIGETQDKKSYLVLNNAGDIGVYFRNPVSPVSRPTDGSKPLIGEAIADIFANADVDDKMTIHKLNGLVRENPDSPPVTVSWVKEYVLPALS